MLRSIAAILLNLQKMFQIKVIPKQIPIIVKLFSTTADF